MTIRCAAIRGAALASGVAVAAAALAVSVDTAAARTCRAAGSHTIEKNRLARVYVTRRGTKRHVLCTRRTGRRLWLDPPAEDLDVERVNRFRLNGAFLAYQRLHLFFRGRTSYAVEVRDVRTRRLERRVDAAPDDGGSRPSSRRDGVRDLVVTRGGAVAWIVHNPYASDSPLQVWRSDASGEALLDSGDEIVPSSLSLDRTIARWRAGDARRSARLAD